MTGPPVPPAPAAGSNAIGTFSIGLAQIGDISPFVYWSTIISQYANSPVIDSLIASFNDAMDLTEEFSEFYDDMLNPPTASGYGLDVIGRIVGVSRTINLPSGTSAFFGFEEAGSSWTPFDVAPFYTGASSSSTKFNLPDNEFRTLIYAKMLTNICDGSIPSINKLLLALFPGRGTCYVTDNGGMSITYKFFFPLTVVEQAILAQTGVLPTPAGVAATIQQGL